MKINTSLSRVIKAVVEQRNIDARAAGQKAVEQRIKEYFVECGAAALVARAKELTKALEEIHTQLEDRGYYHNGNLSRENEEEIRSELMPKLIRVEEVMAKVAMADDATGMKLLKSLGINWQ